jgi:hypothetical protein
MKTIILSILFIALTASVILLGACGSGSAPTAALENPVQGTVIKSGPVGNLTVTLSNDAGKLKSGDQEIYVAFTDASGKATHVGAASLNFHMPAMGSMSAMNDSATLVTTKTPGVYKAKVKVSMPGEWQAQIAYEGAAGNGKTVLPVTAF